jgi:hypothetical protein
MKNVAPPMVPSGEPVGNLFPAFPVRLHRHVSWIQGVAELAGERLNRDYR